MNKKDMLLILCRALKCYKEDYKNKCLDKGEFNVYDNFYISNIDYCQAKVFIAYKESD